MTVEQGSSAGLIDTALKESELYSSLWSSCDELRGGMDASLCKDYVLVLIFIKYVSDKYAGQPYPSPTPRSRSRPAPASRTWSASRASPTSATRSARRSSPPWPTPTSCPIYTGRSQVQGRRQPQDLRLERVIISALLRPLRGIRRRLRPAAAACLRDDRSPLVAARSGSLRTNC